MYYTQIKAAKNVLVRYEELYTSAVPIYFKDKNMKCIPVTALFFLLSHE
jgi:hypothetical protein